MNELNPPQWASDLTADQTEAPAASAIQGTPTVRVAEVTKTFRLPIHVADSITRRKNELAAQGKKVTQQQLVIEAFEAAFGPAPTVTLSADSWRALQEIQQRKQAESGRHLRVGDILEDIIFNAAQGEQN